MDAVNMAHLVDAFNVVWGSNLSIYERAVITRTKTGARTRVIWVGNYRYEQYLGWVEMSPCNCPRDSFDLTRSMMVDLLHGLARYIKRAELYPAMAAEMDDAAPKL